MTTLPRPKALLFDFMGTCLDWHTSVADAILSLPSHTITRQDAAELAMKWRLAYFQESRERIEKGAPPEDIDIVHRNVLDDLLKARQGEAWGEGDKKLLVKAWHNQKAWPDVKPGLGRLRREFDVVVHANGSTRLQIDLVRSSGLNFDAVMSSMMLGYLKPDPRMYLRGLELLQLKPEECLMVAAHRSDVLGAKAVGMQTAYLWRATEDPEEDMDIVKGEFDYFIDGRGGTMEVGIAKLANVLLNRDQ